MLMRYGVALLSVPVLGIAAAPAQVPDAVQVKVVSCDEMSRTIKELKGKVAVAYLWALG
jgi:hypothetical protein